jgi:ketosteroid isomerase-like protein
MTATSASAVPTGGHFDILNAFYDAEQRYINAGGYKAGADFSEVASFFHPDLVVRHGPTVPYPGEWHGVEALERFFVVFAETWSTLDLSELRYFSGETGLAITMRMKATSRSTGKPVDTKVTHVLTIDDGLIREFDVYYADPVGVKEATLP